MRERRVLLVEGKDDEHVVRHLCKAHGIDPSAFEIHQPEGAGEYADAGVEHLLEQVPVRLNSGVDRLAVVLDADEDAQRRWIQLCDRLRRAGFDETPDSPSRDGSVIDFDRQTRIVRFGVWIMPNNRLPGMIEDFLAWLVPREDRMLPHIDRFLEGIPLADRLFAPAHLTKARVHSFLAVQKTPGKPLGLAITFRYLDAKRQDIVMPFLNWLRRVLID